MHAIVKTKKHLYFRVILLVSIGSALLAPTTSKAQVRADYHLEVTLQEQYNDNLTLSETSPTRDFITTFSPGGQLLLDSKTGRLFFDYHLNANFYAKNKDLNYVGHTAFLDGSQAIVRNLIFRVTDNFLLSDEPREILIPEELPAPEEPPSPTEFRVGTRLTRTQYIRNSVSPSLEWRYGKGDFLMLRYRNEIYRNTEESTRDSTRDIFGARGEHWFWPDWGVAYDLSHTKAMFVEGSDFNGQDGLFSLKRRLSPHTLVFLQTGFTNRDFLDEGSVDYVLYRGSLGAEHSFTPLVSGAIRAGYFFQVPDRGKSDGKPEGEASIKVRWVRLQGSAFVRGGYIESYGDAENLGFGTYWAVGAAVHYYFARHVFGALDGSIGWYDFPSSGKRTTWNVRPSLNWRPLKWLTTSLEWQHLEQQSKKGSDYTNNRIFLRITGRY